MEYLRPGGSLWIVTQTGVPAGACLDGLRGFRGRVSVVTDGRFSLWKATLGMTLGGAEAVVDGAQPPNGEDSASLNEEERNAGLKCNADDSDVRERKQQKKKKKKERESTAEAAL